MPILLEKIFPTLMIVGDLLAALCYIPSHDWKHMTYWIAAAVLTFCVTY